MSVDAIDEGSTRRRPSLAPWSSLRQFPSRRWCLPVVALFAVVVAGCSMESGPENGQNSLRPVGRDAVKIDNLFTPIFWVATVIGVLVVGATIVFAIKFRARKGSDDRPKQIHGSTPLEIGWTIIPALILAVVAVPTISTVFDLASEPKDPVEITVVGKQWWWQFDYVKQEGIDQKVITANEMHIPTGRDIFLDLQACDPSLGGGFEGGPGCNVIHSFWVPELAGKRDVVPGRSNTLRLRADEPGTYLGQCAEYCGLSHANMRFRVIAESPADFADWIASQQEGPAVPVDDSGDADELFTTKFQCTNCHTTEDSSLSVYGPNLTHLASRQTFASGYFELTRARLIDWIHDAPALVPMESEGCRLPPGKGVCVGMPSFSRDTPAGLPVMTRQEAATIADWLLELK